MAPTPTTSETRGLLLAEASRLRREISDLLAEIADGRFNLRDLLNRKGDAVLAQIYVVKVLENLREIGKVRAREGLDALNIEHRCRFGDLTPELSRVLLREFKK